jgi:hypothetical protein
MISVREIISDTKVDLKYGKIEKFLINLCMPCLCRIGFHYQSRHENHALTMNVQSVGSKGDRNAYINQKNR